MDDPKSEILVYPAGENTKIDVRLENGTVWLNQKQMAELFQTSIPNINLHIQNVFAEGELSANSVIKEYLITAADSKQYRTKHYNLDLIISVGYRVKSHIGTRFRMWATDKLRDYLIKGYLLDSEKLKAGGTTDNYFEELLERVRDIRTSERLFWQKITDIYATSIDYDANSLISREFFATVQNKFHYAIHGHTAAEIVAERASAEKKNVGLMTWKNAPSGPIRKGDVSIAKNYLNEDEIKQLNLIVDQYLSFAESQAQRRKPMHMREWAEKLHGFLTLNDRNILRHAGKVTHDLAKQLAEKQFEKYESKRRAFEASNPISDFDKIVKQMENQEKKSIKKRRKS